MPNPNQKFKQPRTTCHATRPTPKTPEWTPLDVDETRALVQSASRHPRARWCATIIGPDGTAVGHGCAKGQYPWPENGPPPPENPPDARHGPDSSAYPRDGKCDFPSPEQVAQLADLRRRLNIVVESIARGSCDHGSAESRYLPSRKLRHLVRARTQLCSAPACNAQALYCDIDHTVPYPGGPTDQCNLNPKCRRHHRTKQAPGWKVTQPTPDTVTWTTPSGRTHSTTATVYET